MFLLFYLYGWRLARWTWKCKGVLIAAKHNLSYTNLGTGGSDDGQITFCKISYNGIKIALICIYASNCFNQHFYDLLASTLTDLPEYQLLIGGDFNAVRLHTVDRTGITARRDHHLLHYRNALLIMG